MFVGFSITVYNYGLSEKKMALEFQGIFIFYMYITQWSISEVILDTKNDKWMRFDSN